MKTLKHPVRQNQRRQWLFVLVTAAAALLIAISALVCYPTLRHTMGQSAQVDLSRAMEIDLNTADAQTLCLLPGIGPVKAQAIITYREANGPFASLRDVLNVPGIGEATISGWENYTVVF